MGRKHVGATTETHARKATGAPRGTVMCAPEAPVSVSPGHGQSMAGREDDELIRELIKDGGKRVQAGTVVARHDLRGVLGNTRQRSYTRAFAPLQ